MRFVNIQVLPWFISDVVTNLKGGFLQRDSLLVCRQRIIRQINVCCNISFTFDSGLAYSNNIECLISYFNKIF